MAVSGSTYRTKDNRCLFAIVFFRGNSSYDSLCFRVTQAECVSSRLSCIFTILLACVLICAVCWAWCPVANERKAHVMTQKTIRYFERYFKLPFVKTVAKAGPFGFPVLSRCERIPTGLVCFDEVKPTTSREQFLHCHTTDDKLEKLWLNPDRYIARFAEFDGVYPPDFSQYTDMDPAAAIWNLYRLRVIAAYFSAYGLCVMPVATWSTPDSFQYSFEGLPCRSIIGVSTVGVLRKQICRELFSRGYMEMVRRLQPELVVLYGGKPCFELPGPETLSFPNSHYAWDPSRLGKCDGEVRYGV